jgi:hypothetical protein
MNYDLALMALEGLARSPMTVRVDGNEVLISGSPDSFRELARLCLLLGGAGGTESGFELQSPVHLTSDSALLRLALDDGASLAS